LLGAALLDEALEETLRAAFRNGRVPLRVEFEMAAASG
jgi:hypothetical protein